MLSIILDYAFWRQNSVIGFFAHVAFLVIGFIVINKAFGVIQLDLKRNYSTSFGYASLTIGISLFLFGYYAFVAELFVFVLLAAITYLFQDVGKFQIMISKVRRKL